MLWGLVAAVRPQGGLGTVLEIANLSDTLNIGVSAEPGQHSQSSL